MKRFIIIIIIPGYSKVKVYYPKSLDLVRSFFNDIIKLQRRQLKINYFLITKIL